MRKELVSHPFVHQPFNKQGSRIHENPPQPSIVNRSYSQGKSMPYPPTSHHLNGHINPNPLSIHPGSANLVKSHNAYQISGIRSRITGNFQPKQMN